MDYGIAISSIVASLMVLGLLAFVLMLPAREPLGPWSRTGRWSRIPSLEILFLLIFLIAATVIAIGVAPFVAPALKFVAASSEAQHLAFTTMALAMGAGLFALRKWQRLTYGGTEVLVALIGIMAYPVAPVTGTTLTAATASWALGFMSLIYILVRGLDNIDTALESRRGTPEAVEEALASGTSLPE